MDLAKILISERIDLDIPVSSMSEILSYITDKLTNQGIVNNSDAFLDAVERREQHTTTGIGNGIAIPHGKSDSVKEVAVYIVRTQTPIEWHALDEQPVSVILLLAIPEELKGATHLKLLSTLAIKLMDEKIVAGLKNAISKDEIIELLSK